MFLSSMTTISRLTTFFSSSSICLSLTLTKSLSAPSSCLSRWSMLFSFNQSKPRKHVVVCSLLKESDCFGYSLKNAPKLKNFKLQFFCGNSEALPFGRDQKSFLALVEGVESQSAIFHVLFHEKTLARSQVTQMTNTQKEILSGQLIKKILSIR